MGKFWEKSCQFCKETINQGKFKLEMKKRNIKLIFFLGTKLEQWVFVDK